MKRICLCRCFSESRDLGKGRDFEDADLLIKSPLRKKSNWIKENSEVTEDDKILIRNRIVDFGTGARLAGHNLPLLVR